MKNWGSNNVALFVLVFCLVRPKRPWLHQMYIFALEKVQNVNACQFDCMLQTFRCGGTLSILI
jgi:hypothetical protein